jgi:hypothetical protein
LVVFGYGVLSLKMSFVFGSDHTVPVDSFVVNSIVVLSHFQLPFSSTLFSQSLTFCVFYRDVAEALSSCALRLAFDNKCFNIRVVREEALCLFSPL